jgi:DNA polymerase-1
MSNDETLINTYKEGRDLYSEMASKTFKKPIEECGDGSTYRKQTKILVLAILYGMADFTVSEILGIEYDEASKLRNDFLDTFPKVKAYIQGVKDIVDKQGYVREIGGRKRRFKGHTENVKQFKAVERDVRRRIGDKQFNSIWEFKNLPYKLKRRYSDLSRKVEGVHRQAVNFTIQGSASTWTKRSLIEAHRWCKEQGDDYHLICTVHDENLFELPETVTREQIEEVERRMNTAITINVPSKTDVAIMRRWAENEQTKEEWFNVS